MMDFKLHITKLFIVICAICCISFAVHAENIEKEFDASGIKHIHLDIPRATIIVRTWENSTARVKAQLASDEQSLSIEENKNAIRISLEGPSLGKSDLKSFADIQLVIPKEIQLSGNLYTSNIVVRNLAAPIDMKSVSGSITIYGSKTDKTISTISGNIELVNNQGRSTAKTVSGDIKVQNHFSDLDAVSLSGDISVVGTNFSHVNLNTTSGNIRLLFPKQGETNVTAKSVNGDIVSVFSEPPKGILQLKVGPDGKIYNNTFKATHKNILDTGIVETIGVESFNNRIELSSFSGSVTVDKSTRKKCDNCEKITFKKSVHSFPKYIEVSAQEAHKPKRFKLLDEKKIELNIKFVESASESGITSLAIDLFNNDTNSRQGSVRLIDFSNSNELNCNLTSKGTVRAESKHQAVKKKPINTFTIVKNVKKKNLYQHSIYINGKKMQFETSQIIDGIGFKSLEGKAIVSQNKNFIMEK